MYNISWNECETLSMELAQKVIASKKIYTAVICVSRGGLLIGRMLSSALNLPLGVISAKQINEKYVIDDKVSFLYELKGDVLLVDDVFEERGNDVAKVIKKNYKKVDNIDMACIFYKAERDFKPLFFVNKIKHKLDIVFPYQEASVSSEYENSLE